MSDIYFVTKNKEKYKEFDLIFKPHGISIILHLDTINEIQSDDMEKIIFDKIRKAFAIVRRPVLVDHSGLELSALGGLPKGLTQLFWDKLKEDGVCKLVKAMGDNKAKAIVSLGYCDGQKINVVHNELDGTISESPKGKLGFQWDRIFIPEGEEETFSQMGTTKKNTLSQRSHAIDEMLEKYIR